MSPTTRERLDTLTEPLTETTLGNVAGDPEPIDEGLHLGRAWHRYRYCYRSAGPIRILDVDCGEGRSSVHAARLNPGARVLGIDASAQSIALARHATALRNIAPALDFRTHDLIEPLPADLGRFEFVVCRGSLARSADPAALLANLAGALADDGLLLVTTPSRASLQISGAFRRAVAAILPPGAGDDERLEVGLELFQGLRHDHPIRVHAARTCPEANDPESAARIVAAFFADRHDWTLDEAAAMIDRAGLRFLYAATPWRWRPDRVFAPETPVGRVERLAPDRLSLLIDALDPTLLDDSYSLYACQADYFPIVPDWPTTRLDDPEAFERLIPHRTGLAESQRFLPCGAQGRISYQTVSGTPGELDRWSHLLLTAVDGSSSCGAIERKLAPRARAGDDPRARQERWIDLADNGLVLLGPPDARSNLDKMALA